MYRRSSRMPLVVCAIAQNCLAEAYLAELLGQERGIRVFSLDTYERLSPSQRRQMIFVIDQCGLELPLSKYVNHLIAKWPGAKFVVLDNAKGQEEIVRLLIMGIHGYVPHEEAHTTLARAVFSVAANKLWVPSSIFQAFLTEVGSALRRKVGQPRTAPTPREEEILELVRRRLSNKEIANLLRIRISTVKFHLSNILSKLQVTRRQELTGAPSERLRKLLL